VRRYAPEVTPPRFDDGGVQLAGARLTSIDGRDAAQLFYQVVTPDRVYDLRALTFDAHGIDWSGLQQVDVDGTTLGVDRRDGNNLVIFVDREGYAYAFTSRDLSLEQLAGMVVHSDLVRRVHDSRGRVAQ